MKLFHELFAGRDDVYGTYEVPVGRKPDKNGKVHGVGRLIREPATEEIYTQHLAGTKSIGIVPIMNDDTVWWFAIDVDSYKSENLHVELADKIRTLNLPLLVFSSKSGGAHLYCFLAEPIPAVQARVLAKKWKAALGIEKADIFPGQDKLVGTSFGSWISLPYFGTQRPWMGPEGSGPKGLRQFVEYANEHLFTVEDLAHREAAAEHIRQEMIAEAEDVSLDHAEAPPCVQRMMKDGGLDGYRNNRLTQCAMYLKKAFPDEWEEMLYEFNREYADEPLSMGEVVAIIRSVKRQQRHYMCHKEGIEELCDKKACLKRKFGIGKGTTDFGFAVDKVIKVGTDEPYYKIIVNGTEVKMDLDDFFDHRRFKRAVFAALDFRVPNMKLEEWDNMVNELMKDVEHEEAPIELSSRGRGINYFREWIERSLVPHHKIDAVARGNPYYDQERKVLLFRGTDLLDYCIKHKRYSDAKELWAALEGLGASYEAHQVGNIKMDLWAYPVGTPWWNNEATNVDVF